VPAAAAPRVAILNVRVDALDIPSFLRRVEAFVASGLPHQIITANALMILAAREHPRLAEAFRRADLVVPDSAGVAFAARVRGRSFPSKLPGVELIDVLCAAAARKSWRVFFLGAQPGVAEQAAARLSARHPDLTVVGIRDGFFRGAEDQTIADIAAADPDILFVALDVPRQDAWIQDNLSKLKARVVMGVGGSFDVIAGRLRRSPRWMQQAGLEWLYRLIQEPRRARRMARLPEFFWRVLTERPSLS